MINSMASANSSGENATRSFRLNCRTDAFLRFVHEPGSVVLAFVKDATVIELIGPGVTPLRDLWV